MKRLMLFLYLFTCLPSVATAQVNLENFTDRELSFNGPPGIWVRIGVTGHLGYLIGADQRGRFRVDLYDDGGRFVINQRCEDNRRDDSLFTLVLSTSGGNGFIRNCKGQYQWLNRVEAIDGLLNHFLNGTNRPQPGSHIDSYLIQLQSELSGIRVTR
jgi:hypothetical protein